jgi:CHASE3 domain sensor protein
MNAMSNMKFGKRLAVGFGAVGLLMLLLAGIALWGVDAVSDTSAVALGAQTRAFQMARLDKNVTAIARELATMMILRE